MKKLIIGIKSNRTVALSEEDKKKGKFTKVSKLDLKDGQQTCSEIRKIIQSR